MDAARASEHIGHRVALHSAIEIAEQLVGVDLMSSGQVELGIGHGFVEFDYQGLRISFVISEPSMRNAPRSVAPISFVARRNFNVKSS